MNRNVRILTITVTAITALLLAGISLVRAADQVSPSVPDPGQVGSVVDDFILMDTDGNKHTLSEYLAEHEAVVLEWFNPDCPYVKKYHDGPNPSMAEAVEFVSNQDIVWLAVNSNAPGNQGHGVERNQRAKADYGIDYPILLDENGTVGRNFGATSTPQLFLIGEGRTVLYNGGVDDTRVNEDIPGVNYVIDAVNQFISGKEINPAKTPHPGCSVKYAK